MDDTRMFGLCGIPAPIMGGPCKLLRRIRKIG